MLSSPRSRMLAAVLSLALLVSMIVTPGLVGATPLVPATAPGPTLVIDTDMVVAGVGGLSQADEGGTITLGGIGSGVITSAWLYWAGYAESPDSTALQNVVFNGTSISGTPVGFESTSCQAAGYRSDAYRADVTNLVTGDGAYTVGGLRSEILNRFPYGASVIVFFNDGDTTNDRDVYVYEGLDSTSASSSNGPGWNANLSGNTYPGGAATLTLHVADGEDAAGTDDEDGTFALNGTTFASGEVFQGDSVPVASGATAGEWDIESFSIESALTLGPTAAALTQTGGTDCLELVVATVSVVADNEAPVLEATLTSGGNPYVPGPGNWTNQPVVVTFTCTDNLTLGPGIQPSTTTTVSTEGANQQVSSPACADAAGNTATPQTITGINIDLTNPTIQPIPNQTLDPVNASGTPVVFTTVVADNLTPTNELVVSCVDQFSNPFTSGQYAPAGATTTITCTVTDLAGNTASTSFTVTVLGVGDLFAQLRAMIADLDLDRSVERTLLTQVAIAEMLANGSQSGLSCVQLTSLDLQIKAQESRRRIDRRDAAEIYAQTQQIRSVIGCGGLPG